MDSSVARSNCNGFFYLWELLKEHVHVVHARTIEDLVARLLAYVAMVDANMLWHV
jgi:hypothetical protein